MMDFSTYREQFPIALDKTFLNHAAISPTPKRVVAALEKLFHEFSHEGLIRYPRWMERIEEVRRLFASLLGASPKEVAFVGNTSEGLSLVASGLDWKQGDGVMVPVPDFPANLYPWMNLERLGVNVHFVQRQHGRFDADSLEKALKPGTRLLSISSVDFATGFCSDLEAIGQFCRNKGLLFCVDAIQGLGVIPMDVKKWGIHFLASGGHKWLLSPMGCGGFYVSEEAIDLIHPMRIGWKSVRDPEDFFRIHFDLMPNALRFEPGTLNVAGIIALGVALEFILDIGVDQIHRQILSLNDLLIEGLSHRSLSIASPLEPGSRSGILSFVPSGDPEALFRFLLERNVLLSHRGPMIRLSPHFYNNEADIQAFFRALDAYESG